MIVNDDARKLDKRGALESIASKPAPTGIARPVAYCRSWLASDGRQR
jgi:hypothetical protein